jgi:hypothetical protein
VRTGDFLIAALLVLGALYVISRTKGGFDLFFKIPGSVESAEA